MADILEGLVQQMGELATLAIKRSRQLLGGIRESGGSAATGEPSVFGILSMTGQSVTNGQWLRCDPTTPAPTALVWRA